MLVTDATRVARSAALRTYRRLLHTVPPWEGELDGYRHTPGTPVRDPAIRAKARQRAAALERIELEACWGEFVDATSGAAGTPAPRKLQRAVPATVRYPKLVEKYGPSAVAGGTFAARVMRGWDEKRAWLEPPTPRNKRLNAAQVREIKALLREGVPYATIAREYGVRSQLIGSIRFGRVWKDA